MKSFIIKSNAATRRLLGRLRNTVRRILRSLDLSLALTISLPFFRFELKITRKARERAA